MLAGGSWKSESAVFKMLDLSLVCDVKAGKSKLWSHCLLPWNVCLVVLTPEKKAKSI